jgi:hypothetical protein
MKMKTALHRFHGNLRSRICSHPCFCHRLYKEKNWASQVVELAGDWDDYRQCLPPWEEELEACFSHDGHDERWQPGKWAPLLRQLCH